MLVRDTQPLIATPADTSPRPKLPGELKDFQVSSLRPFKMTQSSVKVLSSLWKYTNCIWSHHLNSGPNFRVYSPICQMRTASISLAGDRSGWKGFLILHTRAIAEGQSATFRKPKQTP